MDLLDFQDYLIADRCMKPITASKRLTLLKHVQKEHGFNLEDFLASRQGADKQRRRLFSRIRQLGFTEASQANYARLLVALADYAEHEGFKCKVVRGDPPEPKAFSKREFDAIRAWRMPRNPLLEKQIQALFWIAYFTAARSIEITGMRLEDFDEENSRIWLENPAKGGWKRWLPVEAEFWQVNRPWFEWRTELTSRHKETLWWTSGRKGQKMEDLVVAAGPHVFRNWIQKHVKPRCEVNVTMHRFRHTRAVALFRAGLDVVFIKEFLGHKKLETTWNYLRRLVGGLSDAFRELKLPAHSNAVR